MKKKSLRLGRFGFALLTGLLLSAGALAQPAAPAVQPPVDASAPLAEPGAHLMSRHEEILARNKAGPVGLAFLGDSITEGWKKAPDIWQSHYGKYDPANLGVGGDTTMGVIWRIGHGELDGIDPRVVVLMLGTNNTSRHDAGQIASGLARIVELIREKLPKTRVLLLAVFPRGPRKNGPEDAMKRMEIISDVNRAIAKLDDGRTVRFLDIGPGFLDSNGRIPAEIMPDQLHPSVEGYRIWADAMQPLLDEMLRQSE